MKSFSHVTSKNEKIDLLLFNNYLKKENGIFIELGANDGEFQSNTCFLEKYHNWTGLLIEPSPSAFSKCVINRPNSICINCACVSNDYKDEYVEGDFNGDPMSSINGNRINQNIKIKVRCYTLEKLLNDNFPNKEIDFLSLDTEGYELEILKGLGKYKPKFILVEIYTKDKEKIFEYLENIGYKGFNFTNYNKVDNPFWDGTHNDYLFELNNDDFVLNLF